MEFSERAAEHDGRYDDLYMRIGPQLQKRSHFEDRQRKTSATYEVHLHVEFSERAAENDARHNDLSVRIRPHGQQTTD